MTSTSTSTSTSTNDSIPACARGGRRLSYRRTSAGVVRLVIEQRPTPRAEWDRVEYAVTDMFDCETRFARLDKDEEEIVVRRSGGEMACTCKDRVRASRGVCKHCAAAKVLLSRGLFNVE